MALLSQRLGHSYLFRGDDGIAADLGGGCGRGGWSAATCARAGNQGFTLRVRDARPGVAAAVVLGTQQLGYVCGACTLIPDPLAVAVGGLTDTHGTAAVPLPLPSLPGLIGASFLQQWITVGGTSCSLGVELSNAQHVTLQ